MKFVQFYYNSAPNNIFAGYMEGKDVVNIHKNDPDIPHDIIGILKTGCLCAVYRLKSNRPQVEPRNTVTLVSPITGMDKVLCVGQNYADLDETPESLQKPVYFIKRPGCVIGPNDDFQIFVSNGAKVGWAVNLAVVINETASHISKEQAYSKCFGYTVSQYMTVIKQSRKKRKKTIPEAAQNCICPTGPWIITQDEIADPHKLGIRCTINGKQRQSSNTKNMIFQIPDIIQYITSKVSLRAGDVILTGTPAGSGSSLTPPEYLRAGDVIKSSIDGVGSFVMKFNIDDEIPCVESTCGKTTTDTTKRRIDTCDDDTCGQIVSGKDEGHVEISQKESICECPKYDKTVSEKTKRDGVKSQKKNKCKCPRTVSDNTKGDVIKSRNKSTCKCDETVSDKTKGALKSRKKRPVSEETKGDVVKSRNKGRCGCDTSHTICNIDTCDGMVCNDIESGVVKSKKKRRFVVKDRKASICGDPSYSEITTGNKEEIRKSSAYYITTPNNKATSAEIQNIVPKNDASTNVTCNELNVDKSTSVQLKTKSKETTDIKTTSEDDTIDIASSDNDDMVECDQASCDNITSNINSGCDDVTCNKRTMLEKLWAKTKRLTKGRGTYRGNKKASCKESKSRFKGIRIPYFKSKSPGIETPCDECENPCFETPCEECKSPCNSVKTPSCKEGDANDETTCTDTEAIETDANDDSSGR